MAYVSVGQGLSRRLFSINFCRIKCLRTKPTKFQKCIFTIQSSLTETVLIHDINKYGKEKYFYFCQTEAASSHHSVFTLCQNTQYADVMLRSQETIWNGSEINVTILHFRNLT